MMSEMLKFASDEQYRHWRGHKMNEQIRIVARAIILKFDGGTVTSTVRPDGNTTLHNPENTPDGLCRACDFILDKVISGELDPRRVLDYGHTHFSNVDIIYHPDDDGEGKHFHIEFDSKGRGFNIQLA